MPSLPGWLRRGGQSQLLKATDRTTYREGSKLWSPSSGACEAVSVKAHLGSVAKYGMLATDYATRNDSLLSQKFRNNQLLLCYQRCLPSTRFAVRPARTTLGVSCQLVYDLAASQTQNQMQGTSFFDTVITNSPTILDLFPSIDQTLLTHRYACLLLNGGLHHINGIGAVDPARVLHTF